MAPPLALLLSFILIILCLQIQPSTAVANTSSSIELTHHLPPNDEEHQQQQSLQPLGLHEDHNYYNHGLTMSYSFVATNRKNDPPCKFTHSIKVAQNDDTHLLAQYMCFALKISPVTECCNNYANVFKTELSNQRDYAKNLGLEENQVRLEVCMNAFIRLSYHACFIYLADNLLVAIENVQW
jgi:hypothetical protein